MKYDETAVLASSDADFMSAWVGFCREGENEKRQWIAGLRARGIKAAHPDDGWVDRRLNSVTLIYTDFNDGVNIDDLVALGSYYGSTRIVRIVDKVQQRFGENRYLFEELRDAQPKSAG
ncbi:hypothetical protein KDW54_06615 [Burkholderia ambifaria]|uniref:hypothetical protein n=1 Tax=Burkholderia ambifaria TaxID=152480 RepID=UPI001B93CE03|nr:hypothetical protein [Burkholderia ambifaria]MBR8182070.1 hypothetical protein [Burkholderia ambifaria]